MTNDDYIQMSGREGIDEYFKIFKSYPSFVVDIGAHWGGLSLYALEMGAENVIAIEANLENLNMIREKVSFDRSRRLILLNAIFCDLHSGQEKKLWHVENSNSGQYSACYDTKESRLKNYNCNAEKVRTMDLDDLSGIIGTDIIIDYLKVDIEGAEFDAFSMNEKTKDFFKWVKFIDFEIHDPANSDYFNREKFLEKHKKYNPNCSITEQYMNFLISCGFDVTMPSCGFGKVLGAKVLAANLNMKGSDA